MTVVLYTLEGLPYGPPLHGESGYEYEVRLGLTGCRIHLAPCSCSPKVNSIHATRHDGITWCLRCGARDIP